ncbi:hypothetical protein CL615_01625 [archaeon]|jgi:hypothetical protein|nr:hypothetical protein [archaeon]|tara:strand:- start:3354 stop:3698 length:345 start_codon:yes stop_codon:yes gene_type:complete
MTIAQCIKYDYNTAQVKDAFETINDNFQTMQEKHFPKYGIHILNPQIDREDLKMLKCYITKCIFLTYQKSIADKLDDETSEEFDLSNKLMEMATANIPNLISKFKNSKVKNFQK